MKIEFASLILLVLFQCSFLHASVVEEELQRTVKSLCRQPLRFITIGTQRIRCDPEPEPGYLPECAKCSSSRHCRQPKCWGGKCTDGSDASLRRCFLRECARCTGSTQCSTKKCWGGKCVYDTTVSKRKCFPHLFKPECASCRSASECITKKCWGGKCVYNTKNSMKRCFPHHPEPCYLLRQAVTDPKEVARIRRECP